MTFITREQIRINAVLGVCTRQRELMAENRRLQKQIKSKDDIVASVAFAVAFTIMVVCLVM